MPSEVLFQKAKGDQALDCVHVIGSCHQCFFVSPRQEEAVRFQVASSVSAVAEVYASLRPGKKKVEQWIVYTLVI